MTPSKVINNPHTPPPKVAAAPQYVCGPDITEKVYNTLKNTETAYNNASASQKAAACGSLFGLTTYNSAWDIDGLDPASAPNPKEGREWDDTTKSWTKELRNDDNKPILGANGKVRKVPFKPWFTNTNACAIPRPDDVCAATVQFAGTCQHAQIVNYVMWGEVNKLCGNSLDKAMAATILRGLRSDQSLVDAQNAMTNIGYNFNSKVRRGPVMAGWSEMVDDKRFAQCTLTCKEPVQSVGFNFNWTGLY